MRTQCLETVYIGYSAKTALPINSFHDKYKKSGGEASGSMATIPAAKDSPEPQDSYLPMRETVFMTYVQNIATGPFNLSVHFSIT
jgi:hypothetical protein